MIDEQVLERALRSEADTYALPPHGPGAIRTAASTRGERPRRRRAWTLAGAAAAVAVVAAVTAQGGAGLPAGIRTAARDADESAYKPVFQDKDGAPSSLAGGGDAYAPVNPGRDNVVRTGEMTVEVEDVPAAIRALTSLASSRRGFVADSRTGGTPESPDGTVTLKVPTAEFDAVVVDAGRLGRVVTSSTSGTDVSGEITDVTARLKSLTAARGQLQTLLAQAKTVGEVLAVQQRITETQTQIEQLQGRQASLADRTTFGTVRVSVHEQGTIERERTGFAKAWHDAVDGFVSAAQGVVAASGTIAFVLLALGALLLVLRPVYRAWVRRLV